ncbi:5b78eb23-c1d0-4594-9212-2aa1f8d5dc2d [Thermothielavioides terrestris]|uniref:5b78eb23-c1d0-4594-9212-2aa1f8d5dc2d n=1 Tax=Thermothielavioides terrestris TaxID=2587410 RepID=A0A446BRM2_9PEZI|nr:5b78eb23-c1d0-4594-9212-2aa1f8d5dc2d [Thermothielavioides terrestris]
MSSNEENWAR